jgi:hypothetical protein
MNRDQQRLEAARRSVSKLLTVGDALGHVDPAAVRAATLVKLTPTAERFGVLLSNLILVNAEGLALLFAGQADEGVISTLLSALEPGSHDVLDAWLVGGLVEFPPASVAEAPEADRP